MPPRKRTTNVAESDLAQRVNSEMMRRTDRSRKAKLPERLHEVNAVEPRQIRKIMAQDLKDARHAAAQGPNRRHALRNFNTSFSGDRHAACGKRTGNKAVRFLTEGSRDITSNELPKCYQDPKGLKPGSKSTRCPCGGSYTSNRARHFRSRKHIGYANSK